MAKMFYTAEEAAEKLGKSVSDLNELASSGQIQEFRDKDKVMFKVDQIDLLADAQADDDDFGDLPLSLEESGELDPLSLSGSAPIMSDDDALSLSGSADMVLDDDVLSLSGDAPMLDDDDDMLSLSGDAPSLTDDVDDLSLSGSAMASPDEIGSLELSASGAIGLEDSAVDSDDSFLGASGLEGTGISAFEPDLDGEETSGGDLLDDDLSLETVGSGSGLLDLTRESDDTSLGAELLDEVYSDESGDLPANASGLFEAADSDSTDADPEIGRDMPAMGSVPMLVDTYDGGWSGLTVGMALVSCAALCMVGLMVFVTSTGTLPPLATMISDQMTMWFGGLIGGVLILGILGFFIGKASE